MSIYSFVSLSLLWESENRSPRHEFGIKLLTVTYVYWRNTKPMPLAVGSEAPNFTVQDTKGNTVSLSSFAGKTVVLYFYPKDDTPGCTKQACSFRDNIADYQGKDIVVLGVSADDQTSHQQFTEKYNLNFPLLADTKQEMIKAYDVDGGGYAKRVTYVIDGNGKIIHVDSSVNTSTHASDVLKAIGL